MSRIRSVIIQNVQPISSANFCDFVVKEEDLVTEILIVD